MGHLVLVGFMGSGKSRVGEILAARLGLPLIETDARVEERRGKRVADVFREEGEACFRDAESEVILGLEGEGPAVVSCGGGAVLRPGNVEALRRAGTVFYLKVAPGEAALRLQGETGRPLLDGLPDRRGRIRALLEEREPLYRGAADHVVDTTGRGAEEVAEEIEGLWRG